MDPAVQVALVSGLLMGTIPASIGAWISSRRTGRRIGTGATPTNELLARVLAGQAGQDNRLARLERDLTQLACDLASLRVHVNDLQ